MCERENVGKRCVKILHALPTSLNRAKSKERERLAERIERIWGENGRLGEEGDPSSLGLGKGKSPK